MILRPFSTPHRRVLSFCVALAASALVAGASPTARRAAPVTAPGAPAPTDTPSGNTPTVVLTTVYAFTVPDSSTGDSPDGANPSALIPDGLGNFLGTTNGGGPDDTGTVFKFTPPGTLATFVSFDVESGGINTDGASPQSGLVPDGAGNFYGTAGQSGTSGNGTIFKIAADGTLTVLHEFSGTDGGFPAASLVYDGTGTLYGTTEYGGPSGTGTIFRIATDGSNFISLHGFSTVTESGNSDGAYPGASLVAESNGNFLGVANSGGTPNGAGTIFQITPAGTFTTLYSFIGNSTDGAYPLAALLGDGSGTTFYGVASEGGSSDSGTVFKISTDGTITGTQFTLLYTFSNSDGSYPASPLILGLDGNFYGTTEYGGDSGDGTLFQITPGGSLALLYSFDGGDNGGFPMGALVQTSTTDFYGVTSSTFEAESDGHLGSHATTAGAKHHHLNQKLSDVTNNGYGTIFQVSVTPLAGVIGFDGSPTVSENAGSATVTVTRTGGSVGAVTVSYGTVEGTALAGLDYTTTSGTLSWADGDATDRTITVPIIDRGVSSGNNVAFNVVLGTPTGGAVLFGTSNTSSADPVTIQDNDSVPAPVITSSRNASGQVGVAFSYQITASNSPTGFATSTLPAGLSVNPTSGLISGTPTVSGSFLITVSATNATGTGVATVSVSLAAAPAPAPVITSALTATAQVGVAFSYQIAASNAPTVFGANNLPAGLSVNGATGLISGTPTVTGGFAVTLLAANATGTGSATLDLSVSAAAVTPPAITSAGTASAIVGQPFSYQITASNAPTSFGTGTLPAGLSVSIATGLISGTPTVNGTFAITLSAANAGGTSTAPLTLTIAPAAAFTEAPTVSLTSPPANITVVVGSAVPLSADVSDPDAVLASVQFLVNGQVVATTGATGPFTAQAVPSAPGQFLLQAVSTDVVGRTSTSSVSVTAVAADPLNPAPTASLLTPINGRTLLAGSHVTISATATALSLGGLNYVSIYADGVVVATFDAAGNILAGARGTPVRQDASSTPLSSLFSTSYTMPGQNKLINMLVAATDKLGHTSVSTLATFTSSVTSDRPPLVGFNNLTALTKVTVGTSTVAQFSASDPDAGTSATSATSASGTGVRRQDASSNAVLASLEFWINGQNLVNNLENLSTASGSYSFPTPMAGKYLLHAVATDASGLTTISDPITVEADAAPPSVSVVALADGQAVASTGEVGKVKLVRTGDLSAALTVRYKVKGSAVAGVDYKLLTGTVTIPAGVGAAKVKVKPLFDAAATGELIAKFKLLPATDASYTLNPTQSVAKIKVFDGE